MSRLYRFPAVDDAAGPRDRRRMLKRLREVAREGDVPLLIYPEGTRSKDGEIGPFRPAGMRLILGARAWEVHVFVVDGMWEHAKFEHLLEGLGSLDARMEYVGVFQWADRKGDPEPFVEDLRQRMIDKLAQMRAGAEPSGFVVSESLGNS